MSATVLEEHIARWSKKLRAGNRAYRRHWPSRLFRHEPVDTAAQILRTGRVLSRHDADREAPTRPDVADPSVIARDTRAHPYARLYFRPLNPTQWHVEGVRATEQIGTPEAHAPILTMLVFDARQILTSNQVRFSDGNMQSPRSQFGSDDNFFHLIDFEHVYHDGALDSSSAAGREIIRARNAEVLHESPMSIRWCLSAILSRSAAERSTLIHLADRQAHPWIERIRVYSKPGIFYNEWAFVDSVDAASDHVTVKFHSYDRRRASVKITISTWPERQVLVESEDQRELGRDWTIPVDLPDGRYLCRVELHGCRAHEATFLLDEVPF